MPRLGSSTLGHTLLTASEIPSTQEFMRRHGIQLGDGIVMVADRQSSGKGETGKMDRDQVEFFTTVKHES